MFNVLTELQDRSIEEIKAFSEQSRLPFAVCLLNIEYDINIGNCVRSAHLMGASHVFILGKKKYDLRGTVGANHYTNVVKLGFSEKREPTSNDIFNGFKQIHSEYQYNPILIEQTPTSIGINSISWLGLTRPCIVIGNENSGIPDYIVELGYPSFYIPQRGVIRSLNAASACAIASFVVSQSLV